MLQRKDENNPIEMKLLKMADDIHNVVSVYLQVCIL